ncbi:unnamed protein product [Ceratitis capitata]|uniref:(Mediterranean fruit fly) hypothetical protein n=1 Tax=Ceratitis capitata TaxID=7213 RepID=A0A811VA32_CERCA|nr:unnamed protein product [Ceratitis capitata]
MILSFILFYVTVYKKLLSLKYTYVRTQKSVISMPVGDCLFFICVHMYIFDARIFCSCSHKSTYIHAYKNYILTFCFGSLFTFTLATRLLPISYACLFACLFHCVRRRHQHTHIQINIDTSKAGCAAAKYQEATAVATLKENMLRCSCCCCVSCAAALC